MWSQKSKSSIESDERIKTLTEKLRGYVDGALREGRQVIIPEVAATYLGVSTAETLGLLMLLESDGLLRHRYRIYCTQDDAVLLEAADKNDLPDEIYCKYCDRHHGSEDLEIEVVFSPPLRQIAYK